MPGRTDRGEGGTRLSLHDGIDAGHQCAGGMLRRLGAARAHHGIPIDLGEFTGGRADCEDRLDIVRRMDAGELFQGRRRGDQPGKAGESGLIQRREDSPQPVGPLGMVLAGVVFEK